MYERNKRSWLKHLDFLFLDLLAITVSFTVAFLVRMDSRNFFRDSSYRSIWLAIIGFHILIAFFFRSYSNIIRRGYLEEAKEILKQNILLLGCVLAYLVFTKQAEIYSRLFWVYFFTLNFCLSVVFRSLRKYSVRESFAERDRRELLVICPGRNAETCLRGLLESQYQPFHVTGLVLGDEGETTPDVPDSVLGIPVVANLDTFMEYTRLHVVDEVLLQMDRDSARAHAIADQLLSMGVVIHFSLEQSLETYPNKQIQRMGDWTVITTSIQTASVMELFLKRVMDVCGALVGLFFTGIAFVFVAPAICIKSPGPAFFSQYRIGKNGRKFRIYKFRSMYTDAEERKKELMEQNKMQGQMFKMDDDPRIIKGIGHFIRNTSIDELPQFWNILKGDMSLVGTRPPTVDEFEQYESHHKVRLSFKPGLTGMWQVSGRSDITDFEEVVRLDEEYIATWNLWLDIKILLKTVVVVLKRKGSE